MTTPAYELALASTFRESLGALDPKQVKAVLETIDKLQAGLSSVHIHALHGVPWVSFVVNRDALRVICSRDGNTLMLVWVDAHDEAYQWAERHRSVKVGKVIRLLTVQAGNDEGRSTTPTTATPTTTVAGPLVDVRDKTFRHVEVGPRLAAQLRALPDEDTLLELAERLEPALAEALLSLAADPDDVQGIVARYARAKDGETVTFKEAMQATVNAERVWLVPPEQAALEAALSADATSWRVFLHASQKRLVSMSTSGPFLVMGGPGTGKTVVALHRVRHLVSLPTINASPAWPVVLTTFSRVLAHQLHIGLVDLCRDDPSRVQSVQTLTLTAAARAVLTLAAQPSSLLLDEDLDAAWAEALRLDGAGRGRAFYAVERDEVVLARGITTVDAYLKAPRGGRGGRLERSAKLQVWAVLSSYEAALAHRGGDDAGGLARRATQLLNDGVVSSPFAAVVCDEVQDASAWELRLLAALATTAGKKEPGPDRLFMVGDGHQRLTKKPTSLRSCGIEVRGRSARLRLNYRTTQGICAQAIELIAGLPMDVIDHDAAIDAAVDAAVDANADPVADHGYRSVRAGPRPIVRQFSSSDDEAAFVADVIRGAVASKAVPVLLLARTTSMVQAMRERLRDRGLTVPILGELDSLPTGVDAVLCTLHRSKGLEAPTVVLCGQQEVPQRYRAGLDVDREQWDRQERLLQYVGMTRARDHCVVTRVEP